MHCMSSGCQALEMIRNSFRTFAGQLICKERFVIIRVTETETNGMGRWDGWQMFGCKILRLFFVLYDVQVHAEHQRNIVYFSPLNEMMNDESNVDLQFT